jgi:hypothetical protein
LVHGKYHFQCFLDLFLAERIGRHFCHCHFIVADNPGNINLEAQALGMGCLNVDTVWHCYIMPENATITKEMKITLIIMVYSFFGYDDKT